jgi:hypothetical protein
MNCRRPSSRRGARNKIVARIVADDVRRGWLLAVLVIAAMAAAGVGWAAERQGHDQSVIESKTGGLVTRITLDFGPQQVWQPSQAAITELHKCTDPISLDCVHKVMEQHGATADAFDFYHLTHWFLLDLKDTGGPVMSASVLDPWRANENTQPALIGGSPVVVYPEDVQVPVESDAGFKALQAEFPALIFWKSAATLETNAVTATGERFVFRYRLLDGCHACAVRGWARVEFDFAPDGTFQRLKLLDIVRK